MRVNHIEIRNFRGIKSLSWRVKGDFNCIIGPGDACKTTILTALDYALSPRTALALDDSDFFNQDVDQDIVIQVTLSDWDEAQPEVRKFFQESKFARFKCGLSDAGSLAEPQEGGPVAVSISLRVDKSLEPKWFVVKGRDEGEAVERTPLYASDRAALGLSRLDFFSDAHFTWSRNSILTRLTTDNQVNLNSILSTLARNVRREDISSDQGVAACQSIADTVRTEAQNAGVRLTALAPRIDIQRQSMNAGAVSLHEDNVPLRNKGSGSKKLIGTAMQMKLHGGKNISVVDEIEIGLEPHRIRGLIYKLMKSGQQVFTTTHSPVVLRELNVANDELYVCMRESSGKVSLVSLSTVPEIQGPVRSNAEAFLGSKIVACEGLTEIGCLRAYDIYRLEASDDPPVWSLATSYFNAGGGSRIRSACPKLLALGYGVAALADNDAPDQLSAAHVEELKKAGTHVCWWDAGNSTERQLLAELPWPQVPVLLKAIADNHDTIKHSTIVHCIITEPRVASQNLGTDPAAWPESELLRHVIGDVINEGEWIKRIEYSYRAFRLALPHLPETGTIKTRLAGLWTWMQSNV